jgi:hypothetical protein
MEVHVLIKLKKLRSFSLQELKKNNQNKKSGCSTDEVKPRTWFKILFHAPCQRTLTEKW